MNKDQQELTLEESVKQVMQTLPPVIRDYLSHGKYTPIARSLMAKYSLRIDQGGILERGMMLLLMGIEDPAEFSKALVEEAKLDQQTVNGIMQDVNEQIFVPLRDEMRKVAPVAPPPPRPLLAGAKLPQVLIPAPPSQKPALRDVLASVMKTSSAPQKVAPPPPPNLPGVPRPSEAFGGGGMPEVRPSLAILKVEPQMPPPPKPVIPSAQPTPPKPIAPITSYSTDPYREPLDEK